MRRVSVHLPTGTRREQTVVSGDWYSWLGADSSVLRPIRPRTRVLLVAEAACACERCVRARRRCLAWLGDGTSRAENPDTDSIDFNGIRQIKMPFASMVHKEQDANPTPAASTSDGRLECRPLRRSNPAYFQLHADVDRWTPYEDPPFSKLRIDVGGLQLAQTCWKLHCAPSQRRLHFRDVTN